VTKIVWLPACRSSKRSTRASRARRTGIPPDTRRTWPTCAETSWAGRASSRSRIACSALYRRRESAVLNESASVSPTFPRASELTGVSPSSERNSRTRWGWSAQPASAARSAQRGRRWHAPVRGGDARCARVASAPGRPPCGRS
jgi:hypothetical protein